MGSVKFGRSGVAMGACPTTGIGVIGLIVSGARGLGLWGAGGRAVLVVVVSVAGVAAIEGKE